jgi:hypothetical protein
VHDQVSVYFGEKIALYFVFLDYYAHSWHGLLGPSILGFAFFFVQKYTSRYLAVQLK